MGKDVDLVAFPNEEAMNWLIGLAKEAANKGYLYRIENDTLTIQIPAFEQYKGNDLATEDSKPSEAPSNPQEGTPLDEKLEKILTSANHGLWSYPQVIAAVKQAFTDEGYKQVIDLTPDVQMWAGKRLMTGERWYNRFVKEIDTLVEEQFGGHYGAVGHDYALEAAKRAADLN